MCADVEDPPTFLLSSGHLYPDVILIGDPHASLIGFINSITFSNLCLTSSDGVLSILFAVAVSE